METGNNSSDSHPSLDRSNLGEIVDPSIKIKLGKQFHSYSSQLLLDKETEEFYQEDNKILSIGEVKDLWKKVQSTENHSGGRKVYLHELLCDSEVVIPELEIPKRNPELEKRVAHLRNVVAEKEYQRMTKNVNFTSRFKPEDSIGYQMKQMNSGLIGVIQLVISLAAAFLFGYMGIEVFVGYTFDLAVRLLLGIMCALIVGAAELYFLAINLAVADSSDTNTSYRTSILSSSSKKIN